MKKEGECERKSVRERERERKSRERERYQIAAVVRPGPAKSGTRNINLYLAFGLQMLTQFRLCSVALPSTFIKK